MKYSYSKLSVFKQCPYRYKLDYIDKHWINIPSIALDFGTLVHAIEEKIALHIMHKEKIDYNYLLDYFNQEMIKIRDTYPTEYYQRDKAGKTYADKKVIYETQGIYRLENYLDTNPHISILGAEIEFNFNFENITFHGFVDRVLYDSKNRNFIIEDIKTYDIAMDIKKLEHPLQHIVYAIALKDLYTLTPKILCKYDLPLVNRKQCAEINLNDLTERLHDICVEISNSDFAPNPSPLCHWCPYSGTFKNQPNQLKDLCFYYSLWTKENRTNEVNMKWLGKEIIIEDRKEGIN